MKPILPVLFMIALPAAATAACDATSGERRVPVLELYTSEGCDSCPPTDRWASTLRTRGLGVDRVVVLGFHVDYWDYLGWTDPFAQRRFSERQRAVNARNHARTIYTPQLLLNGRDYRRQLLRDDFAERLAADRRPPGASIALTLTTASPAGLEVSVTITLNGNVTAPQAYLALYEDALSSQVRAGENRGRHLRHDFVVRDLAGPFSVQPDRPLVLRHTFPLRGSWRASQLSVAAFVEDAASGDILQALARPFCTR